MKFYHQIGIMLALCLFSDLLVSLLPFKFPANVAGMVLMLLLLTAGILKLEWIEELSDILIRNMPIMFIPAISSIINVYDLIAADIVVIVLICFVTTLITFLATVGTINLLIRVQSRLTKPKAGDLK